MRLQRVRPDVTDPGILRLQELLTLDRVLHQCLVIQGVEVDIASRCAYICVVHVFRVRAMKT